MKTAIRSVAMIAAAVLLLVGCGSDGGSDGAASTTAAKATTTTIPVDEAVLAFCGEAQTYIEVLNSLSTGIESSSTTIGDLRSAADQAKAASAAATASKEDLSEAIAAHAEAAESTGETTTTIAPADAVSQHLAALDQAEKEAASAIAAIDDDTVVADAASTVQAAAFNLLLAWGALYNDAGCLGADSAAATALHEIVAGLQADLAAIGLYAGPIDGLYGPQTMAAVATLQKNAGLPETGFMDPASQEALAAELAAAGKQESLEIAAIQGALRAGGYYSGPIDGVWSPDVDSALQALQADQELEPDEPETLDPATLIAIGAALANMADNQTTTTAAPTTAVTTTVAPTTAAPTTAPAPETTTEPVPTTEGY